MAENFKDKACETTQNFENKHSYPDPLKAIQEMTGINGAVPKPTDCNTPHTSPLQNAAAKGANQGAQTGMSGVKGAQTGAQTGGRR
jgi:hypothetical protein